MGEHVFLVVITCCARVVTLCAVEGFVARMCFCVTLEGTSSAAGEFALGLSTCNVVSTRNVVSTCNVGRPREIEPQVIEHPGNLSNWEVEHLGT